MTQKSNESALAIDELVKELRELSQLVGKHFPAENPPLPTIIKAANALESIAPLVKALELVENHPLPSTNEGINEFNMKMVQAAYNMVKVAQQALSAFRIKTKAKMEGLK